MEINAILVKTRLWLIVCNFELQESIAYEETFALVVKWDSIQMLQRYDMTKSILFFKFKDFKNDKVTTIFMLFTIKKNILLLFLYVDDFFFTRNCIKWIIWFKSQLESKFKMLELKKNDMILYLKAKIINIPKDLL